MNAFSAIKVPELDPVEQVLYPLTTQDLLSRYWGREFTHIPGPKSKFEPLFSWKLLNGFLEQFPFQPPRILLYKAGKEIEPDKYSEYRPCVGGRKRYLKSKELTNELKEGATFILNQADELSRPLQAFVTALDRIFRANIHINLYAGFGNENGFLLHWDNHDTLILQVAGKKKWLVYEPTRPHPLREENEPDTEPTGSPIWEGLIEEGGLFHIPRGWWHIAYPVGPSLHLTIGVRSLMGMDLLRWYVNRCMSRPTVRMNLPIWGTEADQRGYVKSLKDELLGAWEPDLIVKLMAEADESGTARPRFRLPDATAQTVLSMSDDTQLRLSSLRRFVITRDPENGAITFRSDKRTWRCNASFFAPLSRLNDGRGHTVGELSALLSDARLKVEAVKFFAELTEAGVLEIDIE